MMVRSGTKEKMTKSLFLLFITKKKLILNLNKKIKLITVKYKKKKQSKK